MVKWNPTPAPTLLGGAAVTISREAAAGVTVKAAVVAAVKLPLVAVSVNPVPADATPNEKVATPSTALMTTLPPPDRVSVTFPSYELSTTIGPIGVDNDGKQASRGDAAGRLGGDDQVVGHFIGGQVGDQEIGDWSAQAGSQVVIGVIEIDSTAVVSGCGCDLVIIGAG